jgi:HEAT repeat protein
MHTMLLVSAVLMVNQSVPPPVPIVVIPPLPAVAPALAQARVALQAVRPSLQSLESLVGLQGLVGLERLAGLSVLADVEDWESFDEDEVTFGAQDPADSLYRAGRRALNRNRYQEAVDVFGELLRRYPRSTYAGQALYWSAFALYRTGDVGTLQRARQLLTQLRDRHPDAALRGDAETLSTRIDGELARLGDVDAQQRIREQAGSGPSSVQTRCADEDDDDDPRIAALNALLQMDAESAIPILRKVLERRDPCSVVLRRKAVFLVSQKRSAETESILLNAVRSDPDAEVRGQAVFWLSQVHTDRAVAILDSLLQSTTDEEILDKVIFALSQQNSPRASQALRTFAERANAPREGREKAIFWLGQRHGSETGEYLRGLYTRLNDDELKEKVIFSVSQNGGAENLRWLMDIALNEREDIELRKKALFWAGQSHGSDIAQLVQLYDRIQSQEMKEQLIFVYSQRRDAAAIDKLFDIAKNDSNRELRKKAIFWLGQSRDPRVPQFLQSLLENP